MPDPSIGRPERLALAVYAKPRLGRSLLDLATSVVPYLALSVLIYLALGISDLAAFALALPAAGFLVRTFAVFHDCTHGSWMPSKRANAYVGRVLGLFVLSPFRRWRHDHAIHHANSGDLDHRGVGDVPTLTVAEYNARSTRGAPRLPGDAQPADHVRARTCDRNDGWATHRDTGPAAADAP